MGIVVMIGIFLLLITFVVGGVTLFFGETFGKVGFLLSALLSTLLPIGYVIFHQDAKSVFGTYLELIIMTILGVLTIAFCVVSVFWMIEGVLRFTPYSLKGILGGSVLLVLIAGLSSFAWWSAHSTELRTVQVAIDHLKHPSKVLYLSDIHIAKKSDLPFLYKLVDLINSVDADFVIINGDFIDGKGFDVGDFKILDSINKEVLYTYGNHEAYAGNEYVYSLLSPTKLRLLSDEKTILKGWEILGLADMHGFDSQANRRLLGHKLEQFKWETDLPKLLILHEPIGPEIAEQYGINFQVAGHTHNGQLFPFTLFVKIAFPYIKGLYTFATSSLFVSSGAGTWGPPMRLGSRSEVILFDFIPKD